MTQKIALNETPKGKRRCFRPLFDIFGVHPNFYLNGRDKTVTWIGCVCSIMLVASIAVISIMEMVSFAQRRNFELYTSDESLPEKPVLDISTKGFLVVFRSIYPENKPYFGMQDKFFTLDFNAIQIALDNVVNGIPWSPNIMPRKQTSCEVLQMDLSNINYSKEDLKGATCVEFETGSMIGGDVNAGVMNYLGLHLNPCKIQQPGDCEVLYNGVLTNTRDTTGPISEYFRDYVLEVSYLQDYFQPNNFTHPLKKNLISQIQQRFDSQR